TAENALVCPLPTGTGTAALRRGTGLVCRRSISLRTPFTTAERMNVVTLGNATSLRPAPLPAVASGLAERDILMVKIADLPNCGPALNRDLANLTRRKHQGRPAAFLVGQTST